MAGTQSKRLNYEDLKSWQTHLGSKGKGVVGLHGD